MGLTRVPGKSMMLLAEKPLVQRVLERIKYSSKIVNVDIEKQFENWSNESKADRPTPYQFKSK